MSSRNRLVAFTIALVSSGLSLQHGTPSVAAQSPTAGKSPSSTYGRTAGSARADAAKIKEAVSAAPEHISAHATVMDWPEGEGASMRALRQGTNGWTCYPSSPHPSGGLGQDPMCLDTQWQNWAEAWMGKKSPSTTTVGIAYMLKGDRGASNTDPYATTATADNHWIHSGPHLMVLVPDTSTLEGLSTEPNNGGPWVMWKGTPYAHVMVPTK
jgi:hypothetical protein